MTRVVIIGPNLSSAAQRKGQMHVHAVDCGDVKSYGPGRKFGGDCPGEREMQIEASSREECTLEVYPPEEFDYDPATEIDLYADDLYIAPCVRFQS